MAESLNQKWAAHCVGALIAAGVRHVVVAPGSRSTPLALAVAERSELKLWSIIDERSAAFFALGLSKAEQRPAAVLCTSGTAGAHFLPAVIEAFEGGTPLVLITADRPWELHGFGAPQTIDQTTLFGRFVRGVELLPAPDEAPGAMDHLVAVVGRLVARAEGPSRGPVHLNAPFREPLAPADGSASPLAYVNPPVFSPGRSHPDVKTVREALEGSLRPLIVCGPRERHDGFGEAVHRLGWRWGMPVLAEAASNARYGFSEGLGLYDAMLRNQKFAEKMRPDVVIRFGGGLTARTPQAWLDSSVARVFHVVEDGALFDPLHRAEQFISADALDFCKELSAGLPRNTEYRDTWLRSSQLIEGRLAAFTTELDEPMLARALVGTLAEGTNLFISSSMPIRDVDAFAPRSKGPLRVFSNRGVNGIDGILSSALGVAAGSKARTVLYTGDVALLHDLSGWLIARKHQLSLTVVVANNDGGGIFSFLPIAERTKHFEALFGTPHGMDFIDIAALGNAQLHRPTDLHEFRRALLAGLEGGLHLIEVRTDRHTNVELHRKYFAALSSALENQQ